MGAGAAKTPPASAQTITAAIRTRIFASLNLVRIAPKNGKIVPINANGTPYSDAYRHAEEDGMNIESIGEIALLVIPIVIAITFHEAAHGYVALMCGDRTALEQGRITLNPLKHIDPIGTIAMPLLLYFATSGNFVFGYAKPVPVNFGNLNHPKRDKIGRAHV